MRLFGKVELTVSELQYYCVSSTFKILHDLSSERREPDCFQSIMICYALVREYQAFGINFLVIRISLIGIFWQISALKLESITVNFYLTRSTLDIVTHSIKSASHPVLL